MNKFRQVFVSSRIKSQTCISPAIDQNNLNCQIKRQSKAPPKDKCLSLRKSSIYLQEKQKNLNSSNSIREQKKGSLNDFCAKHIVSLKKQFPTYFQSILNQLKKDGSVSFQKFEEAQLTNSKQENATSFHQNFLEERHQIGKEFSSGLINIQNHDSINSFQKQKVFSRYEYQNIQFIQNFGLKENSDSKLNNPFNPFQQSNNASKSSFQNIHLIKKENSSNNIIIENQQKEQFSKISLSNVVSDFIQSQSLIDNVESNHINKKQKLIQNKNDELSKQSCSYSEESNKQNMNFEQNQLVYQEQIQDICKKHISHLDRVIQQVINIKTQLLKDVKQIIQRSRSKQKQISKKKESSCSNNKRSQNNKFGQIHVSKLKFPKIPKILTLQLLQKQLYQNSKQAQDNYKQTRNPVQDDDHGIHSNDKFQVKGKRKRRSSPLKNIKFAQQNNKLCNKQGQGFILKKVKQFSVKQNYQFTNRQQSISFQFSSQQQSKNHQNQSFLNNILPSQVAKYSLNSESIKRQLPQRFKRLFNQRQNYYSSGNQIFISDPQNQPQLSDYQNPQKINQNQMNRNSQYRNSLYLHRRNSINQFQLADSFLARLSNKQQINCELSDIQSTNKNKQKFFKGFHIFNDNGIQIDQTKMDYRYSQSQYDGHSKIAVQSDRQQKQKSCQKKKIIKEMDQQIFVNQVQKYFESGCIKFSQGANDSNTDQKNSNKDTMLLSSYESQKKFQKQENQPENPKHSYSTQEKNIYPSQNLQQNDHFINKKVDNLDDIKNLQNSDTCSEYIKQINKHDKSSNSFFSELQREFSSSFQEMHDTNKSNCQNQIEESFQGVSSTNLSLTPPNIKTIKQRVIQYKKIKQQRAKNQGNQPLNKRLQFNKNMQFFISTRKLKFKKVCQKKMEQKQNIRILKIKQEILNFKQEESIVTSVKNQQATIKTNNVEKESKLQKQKQTYENQKVKLQRQILDEEEQQKQDQQLIQLKNSECIYFQRRRKEIYKYPWVKFK